MRKCFKYSERGCPSSTAQVEEQAVQTVHLVGSLELGNLGDATELRVVVAHAEAFAFERVRLHLLVVVGADGVKIGPLAELFELLRRLVQAEDLLDAVIVITHVVPVLKDAERSVDLVLEAELHFDLLII